MANRNTGGGSFGGSRPTPSPSPGPTSGSPRVSAFDSQVRSGGGRPGRRIDPQDPLVYLGPAPLRPNEVSSDGAVTQRRRQGKAKPFSVALGEFYAWDDDERMRWGQFLAGLGLIDDDDVRDWDVLKEMWTTFVKEAAEFSRVGKKVTPWDAARKVAVEFGASDKEDEQFTGTKRFTRKQINLTSPEDAKGVVRAILRDQIGRNPTDEEYAEFIKVLNDAERANPAVEQVAQEFVEGEMVNQTSTVSGGMSEAGVNQLLYEQSRLHPDYGAYQAATRLYNALIDDLVNSPV